MRIKPMAQGNSQNLYCSAKRYGYKFKIMCFFDTGTAYIIQARQTSPNTEYSVEHAYNELKKALSSDMDFELLTPLKGVLKKRFTEKELNDLKTPHKV